MTTARRPRSAGRLARHLQRAERLFLEAELVKHRGCIRETAQAIGVTPRAVHDKLGAYGLQVRASELRTEHRVQGPRVRGRRR